VEKRIIVGVSGASGIPVAQKVLRCIAETENCQALLVMTRGAELVIENETASTVESLRDLADAVFDIDDIGAEIASGTCGCEGMIIVPCSMKTVAGIASGYSDNLLLRAADVMLKERKKLVLVVRETPLSSIHLRNMLEVSHAGACVLPMVMTFYNRPQSIDDMTLHIAAKALEQFGINVDGYRRWKAECH
jgi:4-hydroxy-3-polyprenylbenzoate decarboxylase